MSHSTSSPTRRQIWQSIAYYVAFVALGLVTASLGPTLSDLAAQTRAQLDQISYLFTARALGYMLGSFFGGRSYDRLPGHPTMAAMLAVMAAATALVPVISTLWVMAAVMVLVGIAEGTVDVGGNVLLVWVHGHEVGPFMNALHFFFGAGAFVAPIIIAQLVLASGGIAWPYWTLALLMAPAAVLVALLPSPAAPREAPSSEAGERRDDRWLVVLFAVFFFLYVGAEVGFGGWVYTYALALGLADETTAAYLTSAFWGALTVGRLAGIPIAARVRPLWILLGDLLGGLASVIVVLLWPASAAALWVGALGLGFATASFFPTLVSLAEQRMTISGQVTSWFLVGSSLGGMLLPWLIGQWFESRGPEVTMVVVLVDLVLSLGLWAMIAGRSPRVQPAARRAAPTLE